MNIPSFLLPANMGGPISPESAARKRSMGEGMLYAGMDTSPIASPWQGVSRVAQALVGGYGMRKADEAETEGRRGASAAMAKLLQSGSPDNAAIAEVMENPWLSEGQGRLAAGLLEQNFKKSQPDWKTFENNGDVYRWNQNDPNARPEMFFDAPAQQPQYRPASPEEKAAYGVPPDAPLVIGEDGKPSILSDGGVDINMPGQPNIGSIPQGWQALQDPDTNAWTMSPIPGGPADAEAKKAQTAEDNRVNAQQQRGDLVTQEIDRALGTMQAGVLPDTGVGAWMSWMPGTDAKALSSLLDTIKANIGFEELNKMRQQSPTGGALGQVTERELAFLQAVAGSLDQAQSEEQLTDNLNRLWNVYQDVIHGPGQGPERRPLAFEQEQQQRQGQATGGRIRIDMNGNRIQ